MLTNRTSFVLHADYLTYVCKLSKIQFFLNTRVRSIRILLTHMDCVEPDSSGLDDDVNNFCMFFFKSFVFSLTFDQYCMFFSLFDLLCLSSTYCRSFIMSYKWAVIKQLDIPIMLYYGGM